MNSPPLKGMIAVLWLTLVAGLYYVGHKPLTPDLALHLARAAWQITVALGMVAVGGGLGAWLLRGLALPAPARGSVEALVGLGTLSLGLLAVGTWVGVSAWLAAAVFLGLGVLLRAEILRWARGWAALRPLWDEGGGLGRGIAAGCATLFGITLLMALAPPAKFDALTYHLVLPQAYLAAGRVGYLPWLMFSGMPQLGEVVYTWGMALGGVQAAAVLGWAFGGLAVAGIAGLGAHRLGARAGWVAGAALLSGDTLAILLPSGYVDWLVVLAGVGTLAALDAWREAGLRRALALAGVCAGLALSTKYTAGVLLLGGLAAAGLGGARNAGDAAGSRERWGMALASGFVFGGAAALLFVPWALGNVISTGNPVYPLLFPSGAMDAVRLELLQRQPVWGGWLDALLLPWRATLAGQEGGPGFAAGVGPLLLGLGALAGVGWRGRGARARALLEMAAAVGLVGLTVWAGLSRVSGLLVQTRLYFAAFPAYALLAGAGFGGLEEVRWPGVRLGRVAGAVVVLVFGLNILQVGVGVVRAGAVQVVLGLETPQEYLEANLGMYALVMARLGELPAGARTLMLWEPRSFYCRPGCTPDETLDRWAAAWARSPDAEGFAHRWRAEGFSYLLVYRFGASSFREDPHFAPAIWPALDGLLASLPVEVDFDGVYTLYRLEGR